MLIKSARHALLAASAFGVLAIASTAQAVDAPQASEGDLNVTVSQPAGSYSTFPIPPRQAFVTLSTRF